MAPIVRVGLRSRLDWFECQHRALVAGATLDHVHATPVEEPCVHRGWQQRVSNTVEKVFQTEALWPSLDTNERAALSQSGPLPISARVCRCGRLFDSDCVRALGRRGFEVEVAVARICREGGARVSTNVMVRDPDLSQVPGGRQTVRSRRRRVDPVPRRPLRE